MKKKKKKIRNFQIVEDKDNRFNANICDCSLSGNFTIRAIAIFLFLNLYHRSGQFFFFLFSKWFRLSLRNPLVTKAIGIDFQPSTHSGECSRFAYMAYMASLFKFFVFHFISFHFHVYEKICIFFLLADCLLQAKLIKCMLALFTWTQRWAAANISST